MAHTKGEWKKEGFCVKHNKGFDAVIAECPDYFGNGLANARLIAAAPDLLEACKEALTEWTLHGALTDTARKLKQVITKAEGVYHA